jgi:hypothetical protein
MIHDRLFSYIFYAQLFLIHVGFEVLTAVVMKSAIFWDKTPCSPLKVNRCFRGTYRVKTLSVLAACFHNNLLLDLLYPEDGGDILL